MTYTIDPQTSIGAVHLTSASLERALGFYREVLGFQLLREQSPTATLTADGVTPLLVLTEKPGARPKPPRSTGLYHFAILVPDRRHLARSLRRLVELRYPIDGASDHLVSEALYLSDPDGNGIEIYADRPRAEWPYHNGQLQMATDPLDLPRLLAALQPDEPPWTDLHPQTRIGHIHLHVADLPVAERFYHGVLGFDLVTRYGPGALFVSAGGYHHHIGLNTWAGIGAPPPPPDAVGLHFFTVVLPDAAAMERMISHLETSGVAFARQTDGVRLHDPSGNGIQLALSY